MCVFVCVCGDNIAIYVCVCVRAKLSDTHTYTRGRTRAARPNHKNARLTRTQTQPENSGAREFTVTRPDNERECAHYACHARSADSDAEIGGDELCVSRTRPSHMILHAVY